MRAPVTMEKHLGQRPPRIAESNSKSLVFGSPPPQISESPDYTPETSTIGRAPVQFAGVTNGEALWALPNQQQSPEASSDSNSFAGRPSLSAPTAGVDDLMADIDWDAFDALFPPAQNHELLQPEFRFPNMPGLGPF